MKHNPKRNYFLYFGIIAGILAIVCFGCVMLYAFRSMQAKDSYEEVKEQAEEGKTESGISIEEMEDDEFTGILDVEETKVPSSVRTDMESQPIDFTRLQEINEELYAWIRVPDTNIDYPVAQHEGDDQQFYLHHDLYQEPQFAGCIYSENRNMKDFLDPVTILYGHNMKNGSMFQNLHYFLDDTFFQEHKYLYIYLPDKNYIYEVYAAYPYDDRHIMKYFNFAKADDLRDYIDSTLHPRSMEAKVREEVEVDEKSHILTLSTCISGKPEQRLLVQAVLVYEEKLKEDNK